MDEETIKTLTDAETYALERWWHEDHFGEKCELGGDGVTPHHSTACVEDAFVDGMRATKVVISFPELGAIESLLKTARDYHFADVLDAAWGLIRDLENALSELAAIRREVGASDRCVVEFNGKRCGNERGYHDAYEFSLGHPFTPDPTLAAVQRVVKERMITALLLEGSVSLLEEFLALYGGDSDSHEQRGGRWRKLAEVARRGVHQARGTGAKL